MSRVLVIGDLMLDVRRYGAVSRQSPEAAHCPVLVGAGRKEELGGAANVAQWLAADPQLSVSLIGHYGPDEAGAQLARLCREKRISLFYPGRVEDHARTSTTRKERIYAWPAPNEPMKQLVRLDEDTKHVWAAEEYENLNHYFASAEFDAIVVADYQKSMFVGEWGGKLRRRLAALCDRRDILLFVNSKRPGLWSSEKVDVLICNRGEWSGSWPTMTVEQVAQASPDIDLIVRTLSELGVEGFSRRWDADAVPQWLPTLVEGEPTDVTGAGDAFTAGFADWYLQSETGNEDENLRSAMLRGLKWAAHCCEQIGVGEPYLARKERHARAA